MWAAAQAGDTVRVYFDLDKFVLTKTAQGKIDSVLYNDVINPSDKLLIIGYTDYLGDQGHNDTLSNRRAATIQNYLVNMGMHKEHITLCIGKGEIERTIRSGDGYAPDRHVDIVRLREKSPTAKSTLKPSAVPKISIKSTYLPQLNKTEVGQTLQLSKLYFYTNSHTIREESYKELDKLYNALIENPNLKIQIEGHICCVKGAPDAVDEDVPRSVAAVDEEDSENRYGFIALSRNRALFIYKYLVEKGIDAKRLSYKGFGRSRPIVENERSIDDEDKNKRVEIRVLEK